MTSLASLGLTDEQERLYRHLLRNPRSDLDPTHPAVAELRELGLVDESLTAAAPPWRSNSWYGGAWSRPSAGCPT